MVPVCSSVCIRRDGIYLLVAVQDYQEPGEKVLLDDGCPSAHCSSELHVDTEMQCHHQPFQCRRDSYVVDLVGNDYQPQMEMDV